MPEDDRSAAKLRKRLAIFCDGTWNNADIGGADTNVALLSRAVHATTGTGNVLQSVLYLRGVGTTGLDITQKFDGATGFGIDDNIKSAYTFIAQNYIPGDEIFLFGFSRGAFTARSLVGLISAAGLLRRESLKYLGKAWLYYQYKDCVPHSPAGFANWCAAGGGGRPETHADVAIDFLGVWDTVGALGIPGRVFDNINHNLYGFNDTGLCPIVRRAYHALAIDEHRGSFVPTLWTGNLPADMDVEQVWFAGAHADIGGGYFRRDLADIPLLWMAEKARAAGLILDRTCLPKAKKPVSLGPRHNSSYGLFAFNRIFPTIRQVCGHGFDVPFYKTLYTPTDRNRQRLQVVNEALHSSVLQRFGCKAGVFRGSEGDASGPKSPDVEVYTPDNVAALLLNSWQPKHGVSIAAINPMGLEAPDPEDDGSNVEQLQAAE